MDSSVFMGFYCYARKRENGGGIERLSSTSSNGFQYPLTTFHENEDGGV